MEAINSDFMKGELCLRAMKALHFTLSVGLFFVFWLLFRYSRVAFPHTGDVRYDFYIVGLYALLLFFFNHTYNAYLLGYSRIRTLAFAQFLAQTFSTCIVYVLTAMAWNQLTSPLCFFVMLACCLLLDIYWSDFGNALFYRLNPPKQTILLYRDALDLKRLHELEGKPVERLFHVAEELCCPSDDFASLRPALEGYEAIFVAGLDSTCRNGVLKYCVETGKAGFFLPHVGDVLMKGATHIQSFTSPVLYASHKVLSPEYAFVKRAFDIFASLCGIVLLSPLMAITAIAIKAYDHGPALYKQTRLTKDGKQFKILKFRSMRVDAEKDGKARLSSGENDDRITPIGRIVRKCRLDELPQLFNILKGDMSFVGPRPERPEIAEQYYKQTPDFKLRLQVQAGLTGYAQVYGKYNTEPYEKLEFDLLYINRMSVLTDLRIMFATFGILFKKESTEGFEKTEMISTEQS